MFDIEKLNKFIEEAKALKYPNESVEECKRVDLIEILQGILDIRNVVSK
ncbi:hypothetical protein HRbin01_00711 [archaeon HR01]|nr:hypothetical protein HRbin01_00711 [archaeon HR01]